MATSLPKAVAAVAQLLDEAGIASVVVGRCAWRALGALPGDPGESGGSWVADTRLLCAAPPEALRALPGLVPRAGCRSGWLTTGDGPVELVSSSAPDPTAALRAAPWTVLAVGVDPSSAEVCDPLGGLADLRARQLRPASETARLALPSVAVASARLAAELGLEANEDARTALKPAVAGLSAIPGPPLRHQLDALLLAPSPDRGIALLREAGLEAGLVPGAQPHAAELVARATGLVGRWTAWLVGCSAQRILARLRTPAERARAIERRLALHPADQRIAPRSGAVRKVATRLGSLDAFMEMLALRRHELDLTQDPSPAARRQLDRLAELAGSLAKGDVALAWSGREVMRALGAPPGPAVGRALAFLQDRVQEDPEGNHPEQLRSWLDEWQRAEG